jgi:hypothetical protein
MQGPLEYCQGVRTAVMATGAAGAEPGQDFPGGEASDGLGMAAVGDGGEVDAQLSLERAERLVDGGRL